ncbi:type I secretion system permease/ATPase [Octadecabacter sp. 1_MG-2023]|uniref:type I secretion system permease/ATPase n=1 Tax=unclassified Octadecabacter TaxID=196158 RepID=UPI001C07FE3B|nr:MULTISPECIES: type I secretion system permease/ATPase [unclassified Octadecabacter]MBU2992545.1 type I secretion system permease/ATPase [Octadecabacter sp. B2R22]MDO6734698.1 type I secretion system permease/ATPase [Octadecabacter sp. 1_MG-2023]
MMNKEATSVETRAGRSELIGIRKKSRALYWFVAIFSSFVNALMLTGPLYMLNVYDRVLGSRSYETLIALSVLVGFMYLMMGILDYARGRIMSRVGAQFQTDLDERVFNAVMRARATGRVPTEAATGQNDLQSVQRAVTSPVAMAIFDLPWTLIFVLGIFIFHPYLGYLAIGGGIILVIIAIINQLSSRRPLAEANEATFHAEAMGEQLRSGADMIQALGMRSSAFQRWIDLRNKSLRAGIKAGDLGGGFGSMTKTFRLFLQSAMLGVGAYLVLQGELTPGAMIAGSILMGRALAPIEMLVNQWPVLNRGRSGWASLSRLLGAVPIQKHRTELPRPKSMIAADQVTVLPPGETKASLRMVSFKINPGEAVGVIGPSGAGKSTLARALAGLWVPAGGTIRLDGASLDQYEPDVLGGYVGYLPQTVTLLSGSIRDNIARMSPNPDDAAVIKAAKRAAAHEMILRLPDGYDTIVDETGGRLSGGQVQRVGLARAMYGDPVYLVLDEPNSNLDNEGSVAVNNAIKIMREEGRCVFVMAHRPAAIEQCDKLMYLDGGVLKAFGPTEEVKSQILANRSQIDRGKGQGGGVT